MMPSSWQRYAQQTVPRYTSYPTAADFDDAVTARDVQGWLESVAEDTPVSAYIHIPFCRALCWYCGCATSVPNGYARIADYVAALHMEITHWANALSGRGRLKHLHLGGGSPNALSCSDLINIIDLTRRALYASSELEIDVELDPRTLTQDFIHTLADAGVTRVSLGVQTLAPRVQEAVNRVQPRALITRQIAHLRRAGIHNISFDLMYGLPEQTEADIADACAYAATVGVDRVSVFGYAHVPWFVKRQKVIQAHRLPGLAARHRQQEIARDTLLQYGYVAIGLDHFAKPDDTLTRAQQTGQLTRNFQGYSSDTCDTLLGFGASAISSLANGYAQNHKSINDWRTAIQAGDLAIARGVALNAEDCARRVIIHALMCEFDVNVGQVCETFNLDTQWLDESMRRVSELADDDLCIRDGDQVYIPEQARCLSRIVAACFDNRRKATHAQHAIAV